MQTKGSWSGWLVSQRAAAAFINAPAVEGDTLVVTHIDRLSRGLTYGLQVIEDLHLRGVRVPVPG